MIIECTDSALTQPRAAFLIVRIFPAFTVKFRTL